MIPPDAKLVFNGVIFDVYQWQQVMFDGSFQTFERLKRPDTMLIIAVQDDKILICEDEQPHRGVKLALLGGRADEGETPLESAKRELLEESGMVAQDWELFKTYVPIAKMEWNIHYFIARNISKIAEPDLDTGGERITLRSVTFDEFIELATQPDFGAGEFAADILRMKIDGTISEFRERLFRS